MSKEHMGTNIQDYTEIDTYNYTYINTHISFVKNFVRPLLRIQRYLTCFTDLVTNTLTTSILYIQDTRRYIVLPTFSLLKNLIEDIMRITVVLK